MKKKLFAAAVGVFVVGATVKADVTGSTSQTAVRNFLTSSPRPDRVGAHSQVERIITVANTPTDAKAEDIQLGDTKDLYKQEQEKDTKRFTWAITSDRIEQLPMWKMGDMPPISVAAAEKIAFDWSRRQPLTGYIPERPYAIALVQFPAPYDSRYYYKVHFAVTPNGTDSFWTVHILMDGTVVEPNETKKPNKSEQATPRKPSD